jgi:hypothetical protein
VNSFRRFYGGRFVSTGASKGGITAVYHRYFFPDDVDGTIPYIAPASRDREDPAYQDFLAAALPQPCAERLRDAQVAALTSRREMMLQRLGGNSLQLERLAATAEWGFWQAYGVKACGQVPAESSSDEAFWGFFHAFFVGDAFAAPSMGEPISWAALYYEWLTEQGFAKQVSQHVAPLLSEPWANPNMEDEFHLLVPGVDLPAFDGSVTAGRARLGERRRRGRPPRLRRVRSLERRRARSAVAAKLGAFLRARGQPRRGHPRAPSRRP